MEKCRKFCLLLTWSLPYPPLRSVYLSRTNPLPSPPSSFLPSPHSPLPHSPEIGAPAKRFLIECFLIECFLPPNVSYYKTFPAAKRFDVSCSKTFCDGKHFVTGTFVRKRSVRKRSLRKRSVIYESINLHFPPISPVNLLIYTLFPS